MKYMMRVSLSVQPVFILGGRHGFFIINGSILVCRDLIHSTLLFVIKNPMDMALSYRRHLFKS